MQFQTTGIKLLSNATRKQAKITAIQSFNQIQTCNQSGLKKNNELNSKNVFVNLKLVTCKTKKKLIR